MRRSTFTSLVNEGLKRTTKRPALLFQPVPDVAWDTIIIYDACRGDTIIIYDACRGVSETYENTFHVAELDNDSLTEHLMTHLRLYQGSLLLDRKI